MNPKQALSVKEALLKNVEKQLESEPDSIKLRLQEAQLLVDVGRLEEAKVAYAKILQEAAGQDIVMDHMAERLQAKGFHADALKIYADIVERYPAYFNGHLHYADLLHEEGELAQARTHYELALQLEPDHKKANQGMASVLKDLGEETLAYEHRVKAFKGQPIIQQTYHGTGKPVQLLLLKSPDGGNFPAYDFLDDQLFQAAELMVEFFDPAMPLPPHQLVVNIVGEADRSEQSLKDALKVLARTQAPVINHPDIILNTGRVENARRLRTIPGVVAPEIFVLPKTVLPSADISKMILNEGFHFPLLLRSLGFHTGKFFIQVESMEELLARLPELPGNKTAVIQYVDVRSADGKARKYRVMMVDGKLYPLHLAVSDLWKVHYFSGDMAESPEHRAEDRAFLENMQEVLGPQVMAVLEKIQEMLKLDYGGIDFSLGPDREVIVFEANATMRVIPPSDDEKWAYRKAPVQRVIDAFRQMLIRRSTVE